MVEISESDLKRRTLYAVVGVVGVVAAGAQAVALGLYIHNTGISSKTYKTTIAEQKINIESLTQNLTKTQRALVDTVKSLTERKEDYQTGIKMLSGCLNKEINVKEKLLNAYLRGNISDENSFKWMMNQIPSYIPPKTYVKPKTPTKSSKKK